MSHLSAGGLLLVLGFLWALELLQAVVNTTQCGKIGVKMSHQMRKVVLSFVGNSLAHLSTHSQGLKSCLQPSEGGHGHSRLREYFYTKIPPICCDKYTG